jgi:hypothetical protein
MSVQYVLFLSYRLIYWVRPLHCFKKKKLLIDYQFEYQGNFGTFSAHPVNRIWMLTKKIILVGNVALMNLIPDKASVERLTMINILQMKTIYACTMNMVFNLKSIRFFCCNISITMIDNSTCTHCTVTVSLEINMTLLVSKKVANSKTVPKIQ